MSTLDETPKETGELQAESTLDEILEEADKLQAEGKYTEAIKRLRSHVGRISSDADSQLNEKMREVRRQQVARREQAKQAAEQARNDLTKELDEIVQCYIDVTGQNLWLDEEFGGDEYKALANYRDKLNDTKSEERAEIIIARVKAGFEPGDSRQANHEWLRKQRTLLEDIKHSKEVPGLRKQVGEAITQLEQQQQLLDSRTQHRKYTALLEHYEGLQQKGVQRYVPPDLQGGGYAGDYVAVDKIIAQLREELARYSLEEAQNHLRQVIAGVDETAVDIAVAWNERDREQRQLNKELDIKQIRKHIHLALYQINPKHYIPEYRNETEAEPVPDSDPRPELFINQGMTERASALERALSTALKLYSFVQDCLNRSEEHSLADFYEAYYRHSSSMIHAKLEEKERKALEPYEERKRTIESIKPEKLTDQQLNEQNDELDEFKRKLRCEPFNSPYLPEASRQKIQDLIDFADRRQAELGWHKRMRSELQEFKGLFDACLSPFKADEAKRLVEQLEDRPEDERAFLQKGLAAKLKQYRELADESVTFAELKRAFETALKALEGKPLRSLFNSTLLWQYSDQWENVVGAAGRYSDPQAAQSQYWAQGRFYYLFACAVSKCFEGGAKDSLDGSCLKDYQEAQELLEAAQPIEQYDQKRTAILAEIDQLIKEARDRIEANRQTEEMWRKYVESKISQQNYLECDFKGALANIEQNVPQTERPRLRTRLLNEWRRKLEEQIKSVLDQRPGAR